MYPGVRSAFLTFSQPFEGRVPHMYLDIDGRVTVGVGNLIDTIPDAQKFPFVHKLDGSAATRAEIATDWQAVKNRQDLTHAKDYLDKFNQLTALKLTEDAIDQIVLTSLDQNETLLKQISEFADLEDWPADAQLGLFSLIWALGPAGIQRFRDFRTACAAKDWNAAATQSHMKETGNPGIIPRNVADHILFSNAAEVVLQNLDFSVVRYPDNLAANTPFTPLLPVEPPSITMLDPSTGQPGDSVVITGEHFNDASSVGFGDVSVADMTVDSDTQITVIVPDGSGNVPITVITPGGNSAPSSDAEFAYIFR